MCCVRSGYIFFVRINVMFCSSAGQRKFSKYTTSFQSKFKFQSIKNWSFRCKLFLLPAGREIVNRISNGCQGLHPPMKEKTGYRETEENGLKSLPEKKTFYIQMKI